ncbi:MAG: hypothetical protein KBC73_00540 [Burkholderiaceae bacterium]|nr:hypothetical protein [Burkholderiaceae bacterium]
MQAALPHAKTEAGRAEVRARALPLSRSARNLLLIIEPARPAADWLAMVNGGPAELQALLDAGLVVALAPAPAPAAPDPGWSQARLEAALDGLGYRTLYDRLTERARPALGLIKGYKLILELERCQGPLEVRALAVRFVRQVREIDGAAVADQLARQLAAPE